MDTETKVEWMNLLTLVKEYQDTSDIDDVRLASLLVTMGSTILAKDLLRATGGISDRKILEISPDAYAQCVRKILCDD